MRFAIAAALTSLLLSEALSSPVYSLPKVHQIVEIPDVWIENTAIRSNGNLLLNTIGDGKLYSLNTSQSPPQPQVIAHFKNINGLFGIAEVGKDVFAIPGGDYGAKFQNNTMSLSLLQFVGNETSIRSFLKNPNMVQSMALRHFPITSTLSLALIQYGVRFCGSIPLLAISTSLSSTISLD